MGEFTLQAFYWFFFLLFSVLEHYSHFDTTTRTVLFWMYVLINAYILYRFVIIPLLHLYRYGKVMSMEKAAVIIGKHFNGIDDKLLNILQLNQMTEEDNALINASINQKIDKIATYSFSSVINFSENKKYGKWLAAPIIIMLLFCERQQTYFNRKLSQNYKTQYFF